MRRLTGGVRKGTSRRLLLREFGCRPLVRSWVQSMVALWNRRFTRRVVDASPTCLLKAAVLANMSTPVPGGASWHAGFTTFLKRVGAMPATGLGSGDDLLRLDSDVVLQSFDTWFYSCWQDLPAAPRTTPSDRVACGKYQQHWCAVQGGPGVDILELLVQGRWTDGPD